MDLTFTTLKANSADNKFMTFFLFFPEKMITILNKKHVGTQQKCLRAALLMSNHKMFLWRNKKNIYMILLLSRPMTKNCQKKKKKKKKEFLHSLF